MLLPDSDSVQTRIEFYYSDKLFGFSYLVSFSWNSSDLGEILCFLEVCFVSKTLLFGKDFTRDLEIFQTRLKLRCLISFVLEISYRGWYPSYPVQFRLFCGRLLFSWILAAGFDVPPELKFSGACYYFDVWSAQDFLASLKAWYFKLWLSEVLISILNSCFKWRFSPSFSLC